MYKNGLIISILLILFFGLIPNDVIDTKLFIKNDKLKHVLAFLVLTFFYKFNYGSKSNLDYFILIIFAIVLEIIQYFVGRTFSINDIFASLLGILGYIVLYRLSKLF